MIRYVFTCLLLFTALAAMCQKKKSVVNLISSEHTQGIKRDGSDVLKVYHGIFQQDNSILRSDSAYFYPAQNSFDAFGHVNISQGDTLNIYSDKLNYNGNTHVALLTNNVRMVDKDATLTTNFLTYNTATRIGTYTGGGKLVNKDNTLTSTNGYYFAYTRDSYFRYNVVLNTIDAVIKTDTLRYNTGSRVAYFYGPTHIYGKKNKDTLYTENGTYNTITEQAFFGKRNLYTQNTKSLKGDSLFYDRLKGYGRAVKNVVFNDNEQKITLNGDLGTYYQSDELAVVTRNPWVTIITESKDTTQTDTSLKKPVVPQVAKGKPTLKTLPNTAPVNKDVNIGDAKTTVAKVPKPLPVAVKDTAAKIKRDTIYMVSDTLYTRVLTYKDLKILQEKQRLASIKDTTAAGRAKKAAASKKPSKFLGLEAPKMQPDTSYQHKDFFGYPKKPDPKVAKRPIKGGAPPKSAGRDSTLRSKLKTDSVYLTRKIQLSDTARIRILSGHLHAKIFKSDFQGKADSIFYSSADSTIRCYVNPMMWSEGSQISGDTIYLQMKNKKLDNMDIFPHAFIVNIEKGDTTHFNQVSGKKMKGYFTDNKMSRMYVDGNAESVYFSRDSGKISGMERSLSSRIRVNFKNNEATNITNLVKPETRYGPMEKFTEDERLLKGFIWKPKDRPESKEQIIPALDKKHKYKRTVVTPPALVAKGAQIPPKGVDAKQRPKAIPGKRAVSDTASVKSLKTIIKTDSVLLQVPTGKAIKASKDTIKQR